MEIPVIDFSELEGEKRSQTMAAFHHACEQWGCFMIENHGVDKKLMEKVKSFVNLHYEKNLEPGFYASDIPKCLETGRTGDIDWESSFFISHRPRSNVQDFSNLSKDLQEAMEEYSSQVTKLAEKLSELMCENLGLETDHIKRAFSGKDGPSIGTKVAKYPKCPQPDRVRGLREHTDAGGIILLPQDDKAPGQEFLHEGQFVPVPSSKNNTFFVNTGDQIEVLSNGRYKSVWHRVMADKEGSRLSIATFYNPAGEAVISPARELMYPQGYTFGDYMKLYAATKFQEKEPRFESMKKNMSNGHQNIIIG